MISLRGVSVHNLKNIDVNLPEQKMIAVCGRSGSGKSSLAIDTIFAEGQRRYIETFSPAMRQFLEKFEKPDAEVLDGIPPAVIAGHLDIDSHNDITVGEVTEITDYLAQILHKAGHLFCTKCHREIKVDTPKSICQTLFGTVLIAFEPPLEASAAAFAEVWKEQGFLRAIYHDTVLRLDQPLPPKSYKTGIRIIVDRITVNAENYDRIIESLETAMSFGNGICTVINAETREPQIYSSRLT
jgi:excinuclease ABC subunit A